MSNVSLPEIVSIVAGVFGLAPAQLTSGSIRDSRAVCEARMVAMWLVDQHTTTTGERLAAEFGRNGKQSPAKVRASVRQFDAAIGTVRRELAERIELCQSYIEDAHEANVQKAEAAEAKREALSLRTHRREFA